MHKPPARAKLLEKDTKDTTKTKLIDEANLHIIATSVRLWRVFVFRATSAASSICLLKELAARPPDKA
jgi:hypothetical protein